VPAPKQRRLGGVKPTPLTIEAPAEGIVAHNRIDGPWCPPAEKGKDVVGLRAKFSREIDSDPWIGALA
jgi:hypothetical protein